MDWWKEMKEEEEEKAAVMNGEDKDEQGNDSEVGDPERKEWGGQVWSWDDVDEKKEEDRRKSGEDSLAYVSLVH